MACVLLAAGAACMPVRVTHAQAVPQASNIWPAHTLSHSAAAIKLVERLTEQVIDFNAKATVDVDLLITVDEPLQLASHLTALAERQQTPERKSAWDQRLASSLLEVGATRRAAEIVDAWPNGQHNDGGKKLKIRIARRLYQEAAYPLALKLLSHTDSSSDQQIQRDFDDISARLFLATGDYADAIKVLRRIQGSADYRTRVNRYDLGVSLLHLGQDRQGVEALIQVGRLTAVKGLLRSLRDHANLTLGEHFLAMGKGTTAIPFLQRVGARGRFSNRALLDLGWSRLRPGDSQDNSSSRDDFKVHGWLYPSRSARASIPSAHRQLLRNALSDWLPLRSRDPTDPDVQRGLISMALADTALGNASSAVPLLKQVISGLEQSVRSISAARQYFTGLDQMSTLADNVGIDVSRAAPVLPPYSRLLFTHYTSASFIAALSSYNDLKVIQNNLDGWNKRFAETSSAENSGTTSPPITGDRSHSEFSTIDDSVKVSALEPELKELRRALTATRNQLNENLRAEILDALLLRMKATEYRLNEAHLILAQTYDDNAAP